ncbi:microcystin-dependent protein [Deinobacterium chartae]|uniref:Microcystin-dependent protein n=1 Tax=Deinobacterium chartae TaxID=521158 RepID=A0A841I2T1_9DEIO|nr:tail fiber protein [Deinobacterium chartae]MBB6099987.1 microcystin-dependent protein [Deinobacterium chartae]
MADPFVAEIRIFPFNFAPKGWALCNGQLLPIAQNTALFSLLGTTYGGNGRSTFALPDLQGRAPMHPGQGSGLSLYNLGQAGGSPNVTLIQGEMPMHSHQVRVAPEPGDNLGPNLAMALARSSGGSAYISPGGSSLTQASPQSVGAVGGNAPHNNMMPYLTFNFCIALQGIFPPRS